MTKFAKSFFRTTALLVVICLAVAPVGYGFAGHLGATWGPIWSLLASIVAAMIAGIAAVHIGGLDWGRAELKVIYGCSAWITWSVAVYLASGSAVEGLLALFGWAFGGWVGNQLGVLIRSREVDRAVLRDTWPYIKAMTGPGVAFAVGNIIIISWYAGMYALLYRTIPGSISSNSGQPLYGDFVFFTLMVLKGSGYSPLV